MISKLHRKVPSPNGACVCCSAIGRADTPRKTPRSARGSPPRCRRSSACAARGRGCPAQRTGRLRARYEALRPWERSSAAGCLPVPPRLHRTLLERLALRSRYPLPSHQPLPTRSTGPRAEHLRGWCSASIAGRASTPSSRHRTAARAERAPTLRRWCPDRQRRRLRRSRRRRWGEGVASYIPVTARLVPAPSSVSFVLARVIPT